MPGTEPFYPQICSRIHLLVTYPNAHHRSAIPDHAFQRDSDFQRQPDNVITMMSKVPYLLCVRRKYSYKRIICSRVSLVP